MTKFLVRFLFLPFFLGVAAVSVSAQTTYEPYTFSTFAGTAGLAGSVDGTGAAARFASPSGVAADAANNLYVADTANHTIRKITPAAVVTTFAGLAGVPGSADGTGSAARFNSPIGLAIDSAGNIYVGDADNNTIRKITPARVVTTLAGLAGMTGSADGTGSAARFSGPRGVGVGPAGNVYVADTFNNTIRKVTPAGVVTTFAGSAGMFGSDDGTGSAARFNRPRDVSVDASGNVFVADTANDTIRKITPTRVVTTVAGLAGVSGSADGSVFDARFFGSIGLTVGNTGNIFIADTVNDTIRKISATGVVTTLGGVPVVAGSTDGTGSVARFRSPQGAALDSASKLFISDTGNNTIRLGQPAATPTPSPSPSPSPSVSPSPSPSPSPTPSPTAAQLVNISTRLRVETDQNVAIGGFIINGSDSKSVIIRAIGPSLGDLGVPDALADPVLELRAEDGSLITMNDNWKSDQQTEIEGTMLQPSNDLESAIVITLDPGRYTAIMTGKNQTTGVGLVDVFDLDPAGDSVLGNISTRGLVQGGDNVMIGGFILGQGSENEQVLIRALGPSLTPLGVVGALADPTLELRNADGDLTGSNDDWKSLQQTEIEATNLAPGEDSESALLITLPPGNYTAIIAGKNGSSGVALIEVYGL